MRCATPQSDFRGRRSSFVDVATPHVIELEVREPFQIWVRFDDGVAGVVNLSDSAAVGGIFARWSDEDFWRSAHIVANAGAVAWGDGSEIDVCSLSLYLDVTGQTFENLQAEAAITGVTDLERHAIPGQRHRGGQSRRTARS